MGGMSLMGEASESGRFVVEAGDDFLEVKGFEDEEDVALGTKETEAAISGAEGGEGADDGAEAGAVELDEVFEIEDDVTRASVNEFAELGAQVVVGAADGRFALEVEDGDVAGLTDCDLKAQGAPPERAMGTEGIIRDLWAVGMVERG